MLLTSHVAIAGTTADQRWSPPSVVSGQAPPTPIAGAWLAAFGACMVNGATCGAVRYPLVLVMVSHKRMVNNSG